jgi:hypothetical protein
MRIGKTKWLSAALAGGLLVGLPGVALAQGSMIPPGLYESPAISHPGEVRSYGYHAYRSNGYGAYGSVASAPSSRRTSMSARPIYIPFQGR